MSGNVLVLLLLTFQVPSDVLWLDQFVSSTAKLMSEEILQFKLFFLIEQPALDFSEFIS